MTMRHVVFGLAAAALAQPPGTAEARVLTVPACGGVSHRMVVPGDPADPEQRRDCAKACHAVSDRRGKVSGPKRCC
ncbi:hypothetical protein [Sphingopyxis panaciterrulae]|uniref:Uncharacterized protein n=1 Tax=Sphingopyxis panaciterrulae TaxID=462372 RepID=A0A7W9B253_9SPHN|nr:hypothetical protein [Sphingopyxis panaciterrulae]MBB5704870.1 hypothetical protein [Sphingopyxis panaciterrulae]